LPPALSYVPNTHKRLFPFTHFCSITHNYNLLNIIIIIYYYGTGLSLSFQRRTIDSHHAVCFVRLQFTSSSSLLLTVHKYTLTDDSPAYWISVLWWNSIAGQDLLRWYPWGMTTIRGTIYECFVPRLIYVGIVRCIITINDYITTYFEYLGGYWKYGVSEKTKQKSLGGSFYPVVLIIYYYINIYICSSLFYDFFLCPSLYPFGFFGIKLIIFLFNKWYFSLYYYYYKL